MTLLNRVRLQPLTRLKLEGAVKTCSINTVVMLNLDMILKVTWVMTTVGFAVLLSDYLRLRQQECRNTTDAEGPPKLPDRDYVQQGSSVWCWGDNNTDRMCKFSNLCFSPQHQHFVFFHGEQTMTHGIHNRFQPALVDLSSVPDHNTQYFQYVDLPVSALREFKKVKIYPRTSLIFNRFNPDNLMHVFHDDLLPIYSTLRQITASDLDLFNLNTRLVVMEGWRPGEFVDLYQMFSTEDLVFKQDLVNSEELACFTNAHVGLSKATTWYQYGFKVPQGPKDNITVTAREITQFTDFVCTRLGIEKTDNTESKYIVLFSRRLNRLIVNEVDVTIALAREFDMRVVTLSMESHTVPQQIAVIRKASMLVGVHGSFLTLAMFLPPGAVVVELFPYAVNPEHYEPYKTLANLPGMKLTYTAWRNTEQQNTIPHPDNPWDLGGIAHLDPAKQDAILRSKEVPRHLCCRNPEWLFRIYQDTVVDIPSFLKTVHTAFEDAETNKQSTCQDEFKKMYPGQVVDLTCQTVQSSDGHVGLQLSWQPPWNLPYLDAKDTKYEVWIQEQGKASYMPWILPFTSHVFSERIGAGLDYNVWVRCIVDDTVVGPFADAVQCSTKGS
ncbi:protein O-linked-mannose beta-1,4-N-acetylglucosaminyltransferase 2-like isoform X2 [Branchiostoma lanceolatum]|uniref:protein O-linked-mannose beta-1,4-N-acetylglucosaminyltransferase 2-like isoform X2 n=1 Tax=Branchiostoma lanceolatum TaxID=7740 RepID=UPI0034512DB3